MKKSETFESLEWKAEVTAIFLIGIPITQLSMAEYHIF